MHAHTQSSRPATGAADPADSALARRLRRETRAEVWFDRATRGRYATDASIYQIEPVGVVVPRSEADALTAMAIAVEEGVPVLPRGAGSSQCGQAVGAALIIDNTKYRRELVAVDVERGEAIVQPGIVLDHLNAALKKHGLWFPVDVSTSAQATLGGMAGNNSCGARSIRYGNMVHNVLGLDAVLPDGARHWFGPSAAVADGTPGYRALAAAIQSVARREAAEIEARWPKVLRRVQGYNLDMVVPERDGQPTPHNLAHLLVGSEGTLAYTTQIRLKLARLPTHKVLGICHFPTFRQAMALTQHIVALDPDAVELVDRTMLDLSLENPAFRRVIESFLIGKPEAILLVEFAGEDKDALVARLKRLVEMLADRGLPGCVAQIVAPQHQRDVWEVRKAGLNIMMSMKGEGKPVSFIEDCAVPLEHLADYTDRLTAVFEKHGTRGTWYAHASVGTLHVRPILDMKSDGAGRMRAIAEEACALVREYKGAYSGEHGDGLVRSEWIEPMIGPRLTSALGEIKALFDPKGLMNPGKIVRPSKQDDRSLFRFPPGFTTPAPATALDWSGWLANESPGIAAPRADGNGFAAAVEMCNNNGHCRKFDAGTMCPSFRATRDEQHLTRGRANTLRQALAGQMGMPGGTDALAAPAVMAALDLCVSCKGCKRECPTGVDMARMKIEVLQHHKARHGFTRRDRLVGRLPRYAPWASRVAGLLNLRNRSKFLRNAGEALFALSAARALPRWTARPFLRRAQPRTGAGAEIVLLADTFNNYFEPENLAAAHRVLSAAGYAVHVARGEGRPLCCGRTFLATGHIAEAKVEAARLRAALLPFAARGVPIVGLEPSCLYTLRDEHPGLLPGADADALAGAAVLFEEFVASEDAAGRFALTLKPLPQARAKLHGHCHQKAFDAMGAVQQVLRLIPRLAVETIEASCCGMAGAFGYEAEHHAISLQMGELALLPAVRAADADTLIVADGTSCRHQIRDGTGREAVHVARVLAAALEPG